MAYFRRMTRPEAVGKVGLDYYQAHYHDKVTCDPCAKAGAVPFTDDKHGVPGQDQPWCWAPRYGDACHVCGKDT